MAARVNYSGLAVAGIGFFLTRFTVTVAVYEDPVRFYVAGVVPLTLGLGLAAFGVALAVAEVEASLVRTTAAWCAIGAGTMLVLVLLTLVGSAPGALADPAALRSQVYLSNFLIGGSVGGTLTGLYAAGKRSHRDEARRTADRLQVLNRLLRHEVLNAVTVIKSYVGPDGIDDPRADDLIATHVEEIERTIDEVKDLARRPSGRAVTPPSVALRPCLEASVETVNDRNPGANIELGPSPPDLHVRATDRLELVFTHLLENAIVHAGEPSPALEVSPSADRVSVSVVDGGPGLPDDRRRLLETGEIDRFDDPSTGFGLNVVRLFVEDFAGSIETDAGPDGSSVTVTLRRADAGDAVEAGRRPLPSGVDGVRPAVPYLIVTLLAALLAGGVYGGVSTWLGGSIAGIGVFYGAASPVVGWLTHEFHSVVFGFVFAGLLSLVPTRHRSDPVTHVLIGLAWALVLWVVAAGIVAPVWLRLLGIPAPVPTFSGPILASHLAWGASLGMFTAWGYRNVAPLVSRYSSRSRRPTGET